MPTPKPKTPSPYPGITYDPGTGKWLARLSVFGSRKGGTVGLFDSPSEAADARAAVIRQKLQQLNPRSTSSNTEKPL